ncbi:hypothetical protein OAQ84_01540 [Bdellovibrionales bacterium]|nr:hypothetical protein [Bdellovibrionales bacterium]
MSKRSQNWDEGLAQDLKNKEFAREFVLATAEEGLPLLEVLERVIRAYGIKEFSEEVGIAESNILRALKSGANPTHNTLNQLLNPFNLQLSVGSLESGVA